MQYAYKKDRLMVVVRRRNGFSLPPVIDASSQDPAALVQDGVSRAIKRFVSSNPSSSASSSSPALASSLSRTVSHVLLTLLHKVHYLFPASLLFRSLVFDIHLSF